MVRQQTAHLADVWEAIADDIGDRPAIIHGDQVTLWRDFEARAARLASALAGFGIQAGATVAIDLYNCAEWLEASFAAMKLGAMPANVNYRYLDDELVHLLSDSKAEALIFHASLADRVMPLRARLPGVRAFIMVSDDGSIALPEGALAYEALIADHAPAARITRSDEDCFLSYTGGTTGLPSGVLVQLTRLMSALPTVGPMFSLSREEAMDPIGTAKALAAQGRRIVSLPASPLMHSSGFTMTAVPTLLFGGTVVLLKSRSFDGHEVCRAVAKHRVHMVSIVGDAIGRPLLRAMQEDQASDRHSDLTSLKVMCSAGVAWSGDTKRGLLELLEGGLLIDACGASEGSTYGTRAYRQGDSMSATSFNPAPGLHLRGEDGEWRPAAPGVSGLLANRTASVGYYLNPEKSARTFFTLGGEQYVMPGDFGRIEADGSLTLIGRTSGVINTGGEKVHAEEVEDVLRQLAGVEDSLVFGMPDERFGQRVTALIQASAGVALTAEAVSAHCRAKLAHYKAPRDVLLVPAIPRGPNGKPDYPAAKAIAASPTSLVAG